MATWSVLQWAIERMAVIRMLGLAILLLGMAT